MEVSHLLGILIMKTTEMEIGHKEIFIQINLIEIQHYIFVYSKVKEQVHQIL